VESVLPLFSRHSHLWVEANIEAYICIIIDSTFLDLFSKKVCDRKLTTKVFMVGKDTFHWVMHADEFLAKSIGLGAYGRWKDLRWVSPEQNLSSLTLRNRRESLASADRLHRSFILYRLDR